MADLMTVPTLTESVAWPVSLGSLELKNPVMPASGCFGPELGSLIDINELGALVTKTVFKDRRAGNPAHRLDETPHGMLNSVGIPSPGLSKFMSAVLPEYLRWEPPTIVSLGGLSVRDYWDLAESMSADPLSSEIAAYEVNVSCPNLEQGGVEIGADPQQLGEVIRGVVERVKVPVIAKLTPNVTSIETIAKAAEEAGASALTVSNTLTGIAVDPKTSMPTLGNGVGGLSGPAIKPIVLWLAHSAAQAVEIPVIGCGGISTGQDALDYLLMGSSAVQVGTATFTRPDSMLRILSELAALRGTMDTKSSLTNLGESRVEHTESDRQEHSDVG